MILIKYLTRFPLAILIISCSVHSTYLIANDTYDDSLVSGYQGSFLCNEVQTIEITKRHLYISDIPFELKRLVEKVDSFIYRDEIALTLPIGGDETNFRLLIYTYDAFKNKMPPKYDALCEKL